MIVFNYKTKKYDKATLIFNKDHNKYSIIIKEDVEYYINFTVLETGVVLEITRDGYIEITLNRINQSFRFDEDETLDEAIDEAIDGEKDDEIDKKAEESGSNPQKKPNLVSNHNLKTISPQKLKKKSNIL